MAETQESSWGRWLEEHRHEKAGLAYYLIPCPRCKAPALQYCHFKAPERNGSEAPLCDVRLKVWEALGKPSGYREDIAAGESLVWKMVEATLEEE